MEEEKRQEDDEDRTEADPVLLLEIVDKDTLFGLPGGIGRVVATLLVAAEVYILLRCGLGGRIHQFCFFHGDFTNIATPCN